MLSLLARGRLEGPLNIVEDPETVQTTALEVSIVVVSDTDYLFVCLHLLNNFKVCPIKYLDVTLIQSDKNETIIAHAVKDLEFTRHFLLNLKLIGTEEIKLHPLILAYNRVDAHVLDELGGRFEDKLVERQPLIIKVGMLFANCVNDIIDKVIH